MGVVSCRQQTGITPRLKLPTGVRELVRMYGHVVGSPKKREWARDMSLSFLDRDARICPYLGITHVLHPKIISSEFERFLRKIEDRLAL
jgi:hypothetical protein